MPDALVTLDAIREAAARVGASVRRTPLIEIDPRGRRDFAKCENLQRAGAFKIRGALNMMLQLSDEERRRGIITYSSGNHGQAVALAASMLGCRAVIVMPTTAPAVKVDGARGFGAEVIFAGTTYPERRERAEADAVQHSLTIVPPFDHAHIIAGQGTLGLEILGDCPTAAAVCVPVGGGGLISGVAAAVKQGRPDVRLIGVEPAGAAKMTAALAAGHPVSLEKTASVADGLVALRAGDLTFAHVRAFVDRVVTVTDDQIVEAVGWLARSAKMVVEPSGAVCVAALRAKLLDDVEGPVVAVLSGGNIAPELLAKLLSV
jgi:threonine dehydratase